MIVLRINEWYTTTGFWSSTIAFAPSTSLSVRAAIQSIFNDCFAGIGITKRKKKEIQNNNTLQNYPPLYCHTQHTAHKIK